MGRMPEAVHQKQKRRRRPPDTRKHTVLPVSIRLKSTEKTPACVRLRLTKFLEKIEFNPAVFV